MITRRRPVYGIHGDRKFGPFEWVRHVSDHTHASNKDITVSENTMTYEACICRRTYEIRSLFVSSEGLNIFFDTWNTPQEEMTHLYAALTGDSDSRATSAVSKALASGWGKSFVAPKKKR